MSARSSEYVLVPREPTPEMLDASWATCRNRSPAEYMWTEIANPRDAHYYKTKLRYAAMLAAAPSAPAPSAAARSALQAAHDWHAEQDKALSKQPPSSGPNGTSWMRLQHQEQMAQLAHALAQVAAPPATHPADIAAAVAEERASGDALSGDYLIWSNEHRAWWRPHRYGYTTSLLQAGRYSRFQAISIASSSRGAFPLEGVPDEIAVAVADLPLKVRAIMGAAAGGDQ